MWVRMQRKWNPCAQPVEMQNSSATVENNTKIPQKIKNRCTLWFRDLVSVLTSKGNENGMWTRWMLPMLVAALFTVTMIWKQPECLSMDVKKMWDTRAHTHTHTHTHTCNRILLSHDNEGIRAICNNTDWPWRHHAKWSKSDRERQIPYDLTYTWIQKM